MVYVALATALADKPEAVAIALIVSEAVTLMGPVYCVVEPPTLVAGVVPSVVKKIFAPAVASESETVCVPRYVPAAGLKVGVAVCC
jgi:hypothetical protein